MGLLCVSNGPYFCHDINPPKLLMHKVITNMLKYIMKSFASMITFSYYSQLEEFSRNMIPTGSGL